LSRPFFFELTFLILDKVNPPAKFGGGAAALLLAGLYQGLAAWAPEMAPFLNWTTWALVSAGLLVLGLLIALASTFFAVNKYLRLHTDKLYAQ
jgi:cell division transport system permease protein